MVSLSSYDFFVILSSCHLVILSSCHLVILSFHYLVLLGYTGVHFRLVIYIVVTLDVYIYVPVTQRITFVKSTRSTPQDATDSISFLQLSEGSKLSLYADDMLLYKTISSDADYISLQQGIDLIHTAKKVEFPAHSEHGNVHDT